MIEKAKKICGNVLTITVLLAPLFAYGATEAKTLKSAVEEAARHNPAVLASWNAFEAANHGLRSAKGGFYPKLDLLAEKGRERTEDPQEIRESYDTLSYRLTLTQMLFDGFKTKNDVNAQRFVKLARYYEFKQSSEEVALQTAEAYLDVMRYRSLVAQAKANYEQHQRYYKDIEQRVQSGLGRGVDLAQATARLALAESNVLTEANNLHDISVRYQRLVGVFPSQDMTEPVVPTALIPSERRNALMRAFANNPQLNGAIEGIRSTRAEYKGASSPMMPRFDLRLRKQLDENDRGIVGEYEEEAVELVMTYNLYNGGSDRARKRQTRHLMYEATDIRDRVCREVRQTVSIAYNEIDTKRRLITFLARNEKAIATAREAYRKQFDIGQRTLLDLLDTENEYFEVSRTLTTERYALLFAQLRTLAGMGLLLRALGIEGLEENAVDDLDLRREDELNARCPADSPAMMRIQFSDNLPESRPMRLSEREVMQLNVKFNNQSADLRDESRPEIQRAAKFLCGNPMMRGTVAGHTDASGSAAYNLKLSQSRADSVRSALIAACPKAYGRLSAIGYGEARPIAKNDTELGRATNRRVELELEAKKIRRSETKTGVITIEDLRQSVTNSPP